MFQHVVVIDLGELSRALNMPIVAKYDPDPDGTQNPCHYLMLPTDKSVDDLAVAIRLWSDRIFKANRKIPQDVAKAAREKAEYERVFTIEPDVAASAAPSPPPQAPGGPSQVW